MYEAFDDLPRLLLLLYGRYYPNRGLSASIVWRTIRNIESILMYVRLRFRVWVVSSELSGLVAAILKSPVASDSANAVGGTERIQPCNVVVVVAIAVYLVCNPDQPPGQLFPPSNQESDSVTSCLDSSKQMENKSKATVLTPEGRCNVCLQ